MRQEVVHHLIANFDRLEPMIAMPAIALGFLGMGVMVEAKRRFKLIGAFLSILAWSVLTALSMFDIRPAERIIHTFGGQ